MARRKGELLDTQKTALRCIWKHGRLHASSCFVIGAGGVEMVKIDSRTVVALVGRGLLAGDGNGIIRCTEVGAKLAQELHEFSVSVQQKETD